MNINWLNVEAIKNLSPKIIIIGVVLLGALSVAIVIIVNSNTSTIDSTADSNINEIKADLPSETTLPTTDVSSVFSINAEDSSTNNLDLESNIDESPTSSIVISAVEEIHSTNLDGTGGTPNNDYSDDSPSSNLDTVNNNQPQSSEANHQVLTQSNSDHNQAPPSNTNNQQSVSNVDNSIIPQQDQDDNQDNTNQINSGEDTQQPPVNNDEDSIETPIQVPVLTINQSKQQSQLVIIAQATINGVDKSNDYLWRFVAVNSSSSCVLTAFNEAQHAGRISRINESQKDSYLNKYICFRATKGTHNYLVASLIDINTHFLTQTPTQTSGNTISINVDQRQVGNALRMTASGSGSHTGLTWQYVIITKVLDCNLKNFNDASPNNGNIINITNSNKSKYLNKHICFKATSGTNYGLGGANVKDNLIPTPPSSGPAKIRLYYQKQESWKQNLAIFVTKAARFDRNYAYRYAIIDASETCDASIFAPDSGHTIHMGDGYRIAKSDASSYASKQICWRGSVDNQHDYLGVVPTLSLFNPRVAVGVSPVSSLVVIQSGHYNLDNLDSTAWDGTDSRSGYPSYTYSTSDPNMQDEAGDPLKFRGRHAYGVFKETLSNCPTDRGSSPTDGMVVFNNQELQNNNNCRVTITLVEVKYKRPLSEGGAYEERKVKFSDTLETTVIVKHQ